MTITNSFVLQRTMLELQYVLKFHLNMYLQICYDDGVYLLDQLI